MKTKNEILTVSTIIESIINDKEIPDSSLTPFKFAFVRNQFRIKPFIKERDTLLLEIGKEWNALSEEEKAAKNWPNFLNDHKEWIRLLSEEAEMEFYTVRIADLEPLNGNYSAKAADKLIGTILIE